MELSPNDAPRAARSDDLVDTSFALRPQPRRDARQHEVDRRPLCRVLPLKDREGLGVSLVRLLDRTLDEIRFVAHGDAPADREPDWVWVCGFEPEDLDRVRALREQLGEARLLVTGRQVDPSWREALHGAGVDLALPWPYPLQGLREHLLAPV